ncbi:MAG: type 4a pilus biogenesis protein PilO [Nitrospirota bacterium]
MFAFILEKIQALSPKQRNLSLSSVALVMLGLFIWYVFIPKNEKIQEMKQQVSDLNNDINVRRTKARRLEALRAEYAVLQGQLVELEKQLPPESEVEFLLKQVSDLGEQNGLLVKLWRPEERRADASGIYTEIPMRMSVDGGYHAVGSFFEKINGLSRIVNISGMKLGGAKRDGGRFSVETSFLATTFSVIEKTVQGALPAPPVPAPPVPVPPG